MTLTMDPERLACGTPVDLLLAHLAGDADAVPASHAATCPHCRTAATGLRPGLDTLRRETLGPAPVVPPTVESAVLRRIRAIGRNGHPLELPGAGRGRTTVHSAVIAEVARLAAEQVPGVSRVVVDVGEDLSLSASLAARYGLAFHALADQVRAAIAVELELHLAMRPGRIDVVVTDLC